MTKSKNIILIGMSGVGKTFLGKFISEKLNISFYDTDELIIKKYNMRLSELIKKYSWEWFRNEEYNILKNLLYLNNIIISTGGGIIENNRIDELLKNHSVIYIKRIVNENIKKERLLSKPYDILFQEREPIYIKLANYTYINDIEPVNFLNFYIKVFSSGFTQLDANNNLLDEKSLPNSANCLKK